jgi:hypothetical protein
MNLKPAEIDSTPDHKQYRSIIQPPIMYPSTDTPGAPIMVDYMGVPPSSGADLMVNMSEAPAPATSSDYADYMSAPAPATSSDYADYMSAPAPATSSDYADYMSAPPSAGAMMAEAPPPDWAYSTPSSRMGAPR